MSEAPSGWIADDEKYALVGLSVKTEVIIPSGKISANFWTLVDTSFAMPSNWREWLGSIRADEVADCNVFLLSKQPSQTPDILDAENKRLEQLAWNFYVGLLLSSTFSPAHRPVLLSGVRRDGQIDVRQQQDFDVPYPRVFHPYPAVVANDVRLAAHLGESLDALATAPLQGGHWRLFRTLSVYTEGRVASQIIDRIHQYSRCIDGVILPDIGRTMQQFRSRTELFIGPHHHQLMGEIYDVRSNVEHLHEYRYLETFDRDVRLELVKKEAIVEQSREKCSGASSAIETFGLISPTRPSSLRFGLCPPPIDNRFGVIRSIQTKRWRSLILRTFTTGIWAHSSESS